MKFRFGFTLIELLVVLAIVALLLSIVVPRYIQQTDRAQDAALKENLSTIRHSIDQYYADKGGISIYTTRVSRKTLFKESSYGYSYSSR
ncbi:type II secretion system protein [Acinetobacter sp. BIGb0102]|uniref:type II secretion system protein n=1 Tax=Acinetobacter sp. BIGb0102 TaxID=2485131 RepID=UPI001D1928D4|nr:type II secretion system protein [Acinetobacter sp. BIGb0102]